MYFQRWRVPLLARLILGTESANLQCPRTSSNRTRIRQLWVQSYLMYVLVSCGVFEENAP